MRIEVEDVPGDVIEFYRGRLRGSAGEGLDAGLPEADGGSIGGTNAHLPGARASLPEAESEFSSEAAAPVTAKDKEFRHVPDAGVGEFLYKGESCPIAIEPSEIGATERVGPVERELVVTESAVVSDVFGYELGEVVDVEFEKVGEYRLLVGGGGLDGDGHWLRRAG